MANIEVGNEVLDFKLRPGPDHVHLDEPLRHHGPQNGESKKANHSRLQGAHRGEQGQSCKAPGLLAPRAGELPGDLFTRLRASRGEHRAASSSSQRRVSLGVLIFSFRLNLASLGSNSNGILPPPPQLSSN